MLDGSKESLNRIEKKLDKLLENQEEQARKIKSLFKGLYTRTTITAAVVTVFIKGLI